MPYRKEQFITGEYYHLVIRGIDDNELFKNIDDYYRGIFSIYEFNNTKPVTIRARRKARARIKRVLQKLKRDPNLVADSRDKYVAILSLCLMPNHLHLLVKQLKDGGIIKFMTKLGIGYAKYFNIKYKRKGYVFQNRFVAIHIENEKQLIAVLMYIHTNPISLVEPKWKEGGIRNIEKVFKFLKNYRWSSHLDYLGNKNFPSVTERNFLLEIVNGQQGYERFFKDWLKYKSRKNFKEFSRLFLE